MTRGHQAYTVDSRQLSFRIHHIAGLELSGLDALPDHALDSLVSRRSIATVLSHKSAFQSPNMSRSKSREYVVTSLARD
jgi:hypothetical protein